MSRKDSKCIAYRIHQVILQIAAIRIPFFHWRPVGVVVLWGGSFFAGRTILTLLPQLFPLSMARLVLVMKLIEESKIT